MVAPIYIVTLNWNLAGETTSCVESVIDAGVPKDRIVVVDNGSTDESAATLATHFGPTLDLIRNEQNLGFAGGVNIGIRHALERGAAAILILNNDTVIDPTMLRTLNAAKEKHSLERAGILSPAVYLYEQPERVWRLGDVRRRWLPMPLTLKMSSSKLVDADPIEVDYVTGCGMLIFREVFEQVGLFDTRYFMYFEDADFCRRARDAGFTVWCVPQARMWHKVSLTARRDKPVNRYHRSLGQVRFYSEHRHGPSVALSMVYIFAKLIKTTLGDIVRGEWNLIPPLWKGTMDGFGGRGDKRALNR
jgi:GT2 family glycosyltransferase